MTASLVAQAQISGPDIDYGQLMPMLIVFGAAVLGVLVEAFAARPARYPLQVFIAVVGIVAGFLAVLYAAGVRFNVTDWFYTKEATHAVAAEGALGIDRVGLFIQGILLLLGLVAILLVADRRLERGGDAFAPQASAVPGSQAERVAVATGMAQTEVFPLTLFALAGMLTFAVANDLLTMFVALEVLSLPLYLLCGMARRRRLLSQEAAMKYFLLGAFSSAFFLYGVALLYGYSGSVRLSEIADAISAGASNDALLLLGGGLLGVGLLFKLGVVPFHAWKPDVYQGAPTPITGFMAAATTVSAFGALLRVLYVALPGDKWDWRPMLWGVAILTMVVGAIVAITQTDIKRMLAYSSIAHAGFILTGVIAANKAGLSGSLFYLAAYGFVTIGAFAVVMLVRDASGEATHLSRWAGLGKRSPLVAGVFALFLLAMAGIPTTSGFTGKYAVFLAAIDGGATPLVIVAVVASVIAAFFYVRVIVLMFFSEPPADGPVVAVPSTLTGIAVAAGVAVTLVLGIVPQFALDLADKAALFVA